MPQRCANAIRDHVRRLHRRVAQVQDAEDDGLAWQSLERRQIEVGLRGLDRDLLDDALGQLG